MRADLESPEALGAVDALLACVGLTHGRRQTRAGAWQGGERIVKGGPPSVAGSKRRSQQPGLLTIPAWESFSWLRAGFSTREGGQSSVYGPRGDQNLGWTKHDSPSAVSENRSRFLAAIRTGHLLPLLTVRQMHSGLIRTVAGAEEVRSREWMTPEDHPVLRGDGLISTTPGLMLGIITADCVPVLLADTRTRAVAAFHAGWRGTLARIVERGIGSMRLQCGSRPEDLVAAIGPAIGPCCFAVGEEVRYEFDSQFSYARELFREVYNSDPVREKYPLLFMTARAPGHSNIGPQIHLNLVESNRRQLLDAGVSDARISVMAECTACTRLKSGRRKYFSHRAEDGFTGRMLSVIGAVP